MSEVTTPPGEGDVVGFALWFLNFSTWEGVHGIYLEDLYVRPAARGTGAGRALLATLARICVERGYRRLEWWVLHWNPARDFYDALGARPMADWVPYRVQGEPLQALAMHT
jgi:GNAT superfamily N-acetyltransferase